MTSHVLVLVDDSEDHRFITLTELRRLKANPPFLLEEAARGEDALVIIDKHVRAGARILLLADYRMPRMTGLDLVRTVRSRHQGKNIRLVVYSSTDQGVATESKAAGADEFMVKPMDLHQFRAALRALVDDWYATASAKPVRRTI